jgi:hypothetical protein
VRKQGRRSTLAKLWRAAVLRTLSSGSAVCEERAERMCETSRGSGAPFIGQRGAR